MDLDITLIKLQYEILNVSIHDLADQLNMPEAILQAEVDEQGWKQWWPQEAPLQEIEKDPDVPEDDDEIMALQSEQFLDGARKRLAVYSLAKEIHLSQKYMKLESALIDKASEVLDNISESDPNAIKAMATLYKDMTAKSAMNGLQSITLGEDEGGLPMVTIRDLSGGNRTNS